MATKQDLPATDSAAVLHDLIGDDATAVFESDPKFIDGTPAEDSTSENLQVRKDRGDFQNLPDMKAAPRSKALDEDDEDEVDDEDADDDDDDDDYEDVETEDEEDDDEDEDDDEEDDDDDDDDEDDDEDDEDEDDE